MITHYCRLCMAQGQLKIFDRTLHTTLRHEFGIVGKNSPELSQAICQKCENFMLQMIDFKTNVRNVQKILKAALKNKKNLQKQNNNGIFNNMNLNFLFAVAIQIDNMNKEIANVNNKRPASNKLQPINQQTTSSGWATKRKSESPSVDPKRTKTDTESNPATPNESFATSVSPKDFDTTEPSLQIDTSFETEENTSKKNIQLNEKTNTVCVGCYGKHLRSQLNLQFEFNTTAELDEHNRQVHSDTQQNQNGQCEVISLLSDNESIATEKCDVPAIANIKTEPSDDVLLLRVKNEPKNDDITTTSCVKEEPTDVLVEVSNTAEIPIKTENPATLPNQNITPLVTLLNQNITPLVTQLVTSKKKKKKSKKKKNSKNEAFRKYLLGAVPNSTQTVVSNSTQPVVPNSTQPVVPNSIQTVVPNSTQPVVPNSTQTVVPNSIQPIVPPPQREVKRLGKKARRKLRLQMEQAVRANGTLLPDGISDGKLVSAVLKLDKNQPPIPLVPNKNGQLVKPPYAKIYIPSVTHWRCRLCQTKCDTVNELETHFIECTVRRTCYICKEVFSCSQDRFLHKAVAHSAETMSIETYQKKMKRIMNDDGKFVA